MFSKLFNRAGQRAAAGVLSFGVILFVGMVPFEALAEENFQYTGTGGGMTAQTVGSAVGGTVACMPQLAATLGFGASSAGAATVANAAPGLPTKDTGAQLQNILSLTTLNSTFGINLSNAIFDNFLGCVARAIARAALQQMAVSTVNWINSGFNGSPAFIENYSSFFENVADQAAGQIISDAGLAFLCSPFKLQVKIALARSYAAGGVPRSCTLTQITNNIQGFMNNFSQGGWPAFISFTTQPSNNPFGGYMIAQGQLANAVANAQDINRFDLSLGNGFGSMQENKNCRPVSVTQGPNLDGSAGSAQEYVTSPDGGTTKVSAIKSGQAVVKIGGQDNLCDVVNTTPGTVIDESLAKVLGSNSDSLVGAKYFDEIINALISQLIQNVLYSGLGNLSEGAGYGYNQYGTIDNSILTNTIEQNAPLYTDGANQVIAIDDANLASLQSSADQLSTLKQCWLDWATTTQIYINKVPVTLTEAERTQALANASSTQADINRLALPIGTYTDQRLKARSSIDTLNNFQNAIRAAPNEMAKSTIVSEFSADVLRGIFFDSGSVNNALEDKTRLTSELGILNANTASNLNQCHAFYTPTN